MVAASVDILVVAVAAAVGSQPGCTGIAAVAVVQETAAVAAHILVDSVPTDRDSLAFADHYSQQEAF